MKALKIFLAAWIAEVVAQNSLTKNASVKFLQGMANVTDAQATDFFDELAALFGTLRMTHGSYKQMTSFITDDGGSAITMFCEGGAQLILNLPSVPPVLKALRTFEKDRSKVEIAEDIAAVKTFRDAFTSADRNEQRAVKRALRAGLEALRAERAALNDEPYKPATQAERAARRGL